VRRGLEQAKRSSGAYGGRAFVPGKSGTAWAEIATNSQ
jgi:hypothetical protein